VLALLTLLAAADPTGALAAAPTVEPLTAPDGTRGLRAIFLVHAPPDVVLETLWDVRRFRQIFPDIEALEVVAEGPGFVDARFTTLDHCGDVFQPLTDGLIAESDITDGFELARGERPGRLSADEITLFKSGGGGHEDLGTAQHLMARLRAE